MPNFVSTEIIASFSFRGLCLSIIKPIAPYFRPSLSLGNISFTRLYSAESVLPGSFFIISDYGISPAYCLIIASSSSVQGDVFLFDMLKRQMIINIIRQGRGFSGGIRLCLAPAIQHLHGQGFDFGCISLYTFLVSPFSRFNWPDRKSTRLNSSHVAISYAGCCLKRKEHGRDAFLRRWPHAVTRVSRQIAASAKRSCPPRPPEKRRVRR